MDDNQNINNQPLPIPAEQPMPVAPRRRMNRPAYRVGFTKSIYPKWVTSYGVVVYLVVLAIVSFVYSTYSMPWYYMLSGIVSVLVFFLYGSTLTNTMSVLRITKDQLFEKRIFLISFLIRVVWMFLIYSIFMQNYGDSFGFEAGDASAYHDLGEFVAGLIQEGNFHFYDEISRWSGNSNIDDMGYGIYMGFVYLLTDNSIIFLRLIKCLLSSITVVLIYRLAKRNFDAPTARMAAIFVALWPNFWYYCGVHLKEVEMVFLSVLFVEQADQMLRSRNFTAWKVVPILLIGAALFGFRTPLALVAMLALLFSIVMSSQRVVSWGKRVIVGGLAMILILVTMGNRISEEARSLMNSAQSSAQQDNMEWRSKREHGNEFAKYAGKSVFAPLIFTIPFPSMVRPYDGQDEQQLLNGGNFIKNILSCFTIFAVIMLLMSGKWRDHLLPLSFMLGYIVVLTMSTFAQSERFHQPAMAFEFMFVAYGLSIAVTKRKYKRWFTYWCALMFVAVIAWNWFKLAGRGLT